MWRVKVEMQIMGGGREREREKERKIRLMKLLHHQQQPSDSSSGFGEQGVPSTSVVSLEMLKSRSRRLETSSGNPKPFQSTLELEFTMTYQRQPSQWAKKANPLTRRTIFHAFVSCGGWRCKGSNRIKGCEGRLKLAEVLSRSGGAVSRFLRFLSMCLPAIFEET